MNLDQTLGQIRPLTVLIGTVCIIAGLAKFFGAPVPLYHQWWELGLAGWLLKQV